jgi:hypothetical protein
VQTGGAIFFLMMENGLLNFGPDAGTEMAQYLS